MSTTTTGNHTLRTITAAGTSNTAGSTATGTTLDLRTTVGPHLLTLKITNGGTGPTVACTATVNTSGDGSAWKFFQAFTATTTNSAVAEWPVEIPAGTMYLQVVFAGNTAQTVTVEAFVQELTSYTTA